jgi:hypothetical protein
MLLDDRHIDHGKGSKLVSDFFVGLDESETELKVRSKLLETKLVYHYTMEKHRAGFCCRHYRLYG